MKKVYLILAATVGMTLASCTTNDYVGEEKNVGSYVDDGSIKFGFDTENMTRADIAGGSAATLLGNNFYVAGTKGTEAAGNPSPNIVFDNYLVHFETNTAGTTESNTANWEYVGITPGTDPVADYPKLSPASITAQTIKYWDYSTAQYDFLAFSTGTYKPVTGTPTTGQIGVTAMKYGAGLAGSAVAYTFTLPDAAALKQAYVTDIVKVTKANYGKEVTLRFKNLGSKVRMGIYETVPGYSVKDVKFYQVDNATNSDISNIYYTQVEADDYNTSNHLSPGDSDYKTTSSIKSAAAAKADDATLISGNSGGLPTNGTIQVIFPHVGTSNATEADYNKVAGHVTPLSSGATTETYHGFGNLSNFAAAEKSEPTGNYLGRTLPTATFAGDSKVEYFDVMFPITSTAPLTLRVDFTLVSIDGSKEEIKVYGAKAVVPSTYLNWLPNYAYTYIFKISDNTNGWTNSVAGSSDPAGLFPITFDAVVAEATDATGEQTTVTTVATPSITTYQQGHTYKTNEYSKATANNIYVQVMDNSTVPATLVTTLSATNSLLYELEIPTGSSVTETEAAVMDALQKRTTALTAADVTGRNGLALTKSSAIDNAVTKIVNDVTDEPITVTAGKAAEITIASLTADKSYAYVYDYTPAAKTVVTEFQPITPGTTAVGETGKTYYTLTTTTLKDITATTAANEAVDNDYIYFSKISDGAATPTYTYSYVSVIGKTKLPAGLIKVAKGSLTSSVAGNAAPVAGTFYFDKYFSNNGKYAVKVIKIVA